MTYPEPASGLPRGEDVQAQAEPVVPSLRVTRRVIDPDALPAGSPPVQLAFLITRWHRCTLASVAMESRDVEVFLALVGLGPLPDLPERQAGLQGVPTTSGESCDRCGRKLQFMHRIGGKTYGRICATKE